MLIQDKKLKNGTPDSREASASCESIEVSETNVSQTATKAKGQWPSDLYIAIPVDSGHAHW